MHLTTLLTGAIGLTSVLAHPGHDHHAEQLERREALKFSTRNLAHCADKIKARGIEARNIQRRMQLASTLVNRGTIKGRDLATLLNVSHASSAHYTLDTPESTVFASNNSCVLSPEATEGPYYVAGEYIRSNVTEGQAGVALAFDIQVLDTTTCEPVPNVYLEIWHANSTGVYSGVSASGNGNSDTNPTANLAATFLRGVQLTSADGSVQFHTLVPGHYSGRTPHIHVMVHGNGTARPNGTLFDTVAAHAGQAFFDQSLIYSVADVSPYSSNAQPFTTNAEDGILGEEAETSDPFVEYVMLGDRLEDGLLGWLSFGVNMTLNRTVTAAVNLYEGGGVTNPNAGGGGGPGGPGGPPGNGTRPSGGPPGSVSSSSAAGATTAA